MNFTSTASQLTDLSTDALVLFLKQDEGAPEEKLLDRLCEGQIKKLRANADFTGELTRVRVLFNIGGFKRILLAGLGKKADLTLEKLREATSVATQTLKSLPLVKVSLLMPKIPGSRARIIAQALSETIILSSYEFPYYKTSQKIKPKFEDVELITAKNETREAKIGLTTGRIIANAVITARDLGNHPANFATPEHLAKHARALSKQYPAIKTKVLERAEMQNERMGAVLAVSQGSEEEPRFIIMEYMPRKNAPTIVLVGKGLTFDAGGISIKPSEKMDEMKYDMAGGANVMGLIQAAAELKMPVNLVGLIPASENLPSGRALKPGDIIKGRSGKTIEVVNTDAEGRLLLSDALDYAKKYNPVLVIDFATLTGSIVVALGDDLIGAFSNHEKYLGQLLTAAKTAGEKTWHMPLDKDYEMFIKSDFADLRNQSTIRYGDAIHAANFLNAFTDYPWIHLDIAGVAWATREKPYRPKGATGTGIRMAIEFLKNFKK